jgi:hypothetical protein
MIYYTINIYVIQYTWHCMYTWYIIIHICIEIYIGVCVFVCLCACVCVGGGERGILRNLSDLRRNFLSYQTEALKEFRVGNDPIAIRIHSPAGIKKKKKAKVRGRVERVPTRADNIRHGWIQMHRTDKHVHVPWEATCILRLHGVEGCRAVAWDAACCLPPSAQPCLRAQTAHKPCTDHVQTMHRPCIDHAQTHRPCTDHASYSKRRRGKHTQHTHIQPLRYWRWNSHI